MDAPDMGQMLEMRPCTAVDFTMRVRPGQSLSVICQQHYGSARKDLVQRVAAYNGLDDPNRIRVGNELYLPAESILYGAH